MSCQCRWIFAFATHHWLVVNNKGKISRWEVLWEKSACCGKQWGHLYLDSRKPFQAFGTFSPDGKPLWDPELLGYLEGGEGSSAEKMVKFIENSPTMYPLCNNYS